MSYAANLAAQFRRSAGGYLDKILKGAYPRELPIRLPTKFDLVSNLKTVKAIGLEIPAPCPRKLLRLSSELCELS
jgi:putative tryptophan/tyrosine transport system substrate-binding protein